jgi:hypothetical protein
MSSLVNITLGDETVGSVVLTQPEQGFASTRTANGFRIQIPAVVSLWSPSGSGLPLILENLRVVFLHDEDGKQTEVGVAAYSATLSSPRREIAISLSWDWTLDGFAFYEHLRSGRQATFRLIASGDIRYVLVEQSSSQTGREPCSVARTFFQPGNVSYSQMIWTKMMRDLNLRDSVLVEIPIQSDPPTGWEPVWDALRDARDWFDRGGSTGWKGTAISVRLALEEWRKIEAEDKGPTEPRQRSKSQRTDNIRWELMQLANFSAHTKADGWNRDDALLLLSSVCALLAVRKP